MINPHHLLPSSQLVERWSAHRREAVAMLALAVREGEFEGEDLETLAIVVHKIAGTAAIFGEAPLGICAAELERALRSDVAPEERLHLAKKMLAAA